MTNNATNTPRLTTNGQLIIGNTGGLPLASTLTAGPNISITNAPGSITIEASGTGGTGFSSVVRQIFTSSGTYTPSANMLYCDIEVVGGGGGGEGINGGATGSAGSGAGGGGYAKSIFSAATIGTSQTVTIGTGGTGGSAVGGTGANGTTTSVGTLITGAGGTGASAGGIPGPGGSSTGGQYKLDGEVGSVAFQDTNTLDFISGRGGCSFFGFGGEEAVGSSVGQNGQDFGSGGSGGSAGVGGLNVGGDGSSGFVTILEYIGTGATLEAITYVNDAQSPYTVLLNDNYISVDCSSGAVSLLFPNSPIAGQTWVIKDATGSAAINNISLTTPGGFDLIDGVTNYMMNTAYQSVSLIANASSNYEVF